MGHNFRARDMNGTVGIFTEVEMGNLVVVIKWIYGCGSHIDRDVVGT